MGETTATAGSGAKKIPIVLLPGIAGTRLIDVNTGNLVWNPTGVIPGEPGSFAADEAALGDINRQLEPDEVHQFSSKDKRAKAAPIRHFYNVINRFYGDLALALHYDLGSKLAPLKLAPVVYCSGYDWRRNNDEGARRLRTVVNEARRECDGERVILVAHSMGSIVARQFCKNLSGEAQARALVVIGGPTHGAIKAYRFLKIGFPFTDPIRRALNISADESRDLLRRLPAVYQLLPTQVYCSRVRTSWATFNREHTGRNEAALLPVPAMQFGDNSNSALFYLDPYTGFSGEPATRALVRTNVGVAGIFDFGLQVANTAYMHPHTLCYFTGGRNTPGLFRVDFQGVSGSGPTFTVVSRLNETATIRGDETVPEDSANPAFISQSFKKTRAFGADHVGLSSDSGVIQALLDDIVEIVKP